MSTIIIGRLNRKTVPFAFESVARPDRRTFETSSPISCRGFQDEDNNNNNKTSYGKRLTFPKGRFYNNGLKIICNSIGCPLMLITDIYV